MLPTPASPLPEAHPAAVRTVEIRPPNERGETWAVVRAAAVIAVLAAAYIGSTSQPNSDPNSAASRRPPYQRLFADLPSPEQRMFRELQEGLLEAENTRLAARRWPEVAELAAAGVPPFAPPPRKPPAERWALHRDGLVVNYLGLPTRAGQPAYLLLILEPDPATPHGIVPVDEEHHRLADGTILHVSIWLRREAPGDGERVVTVPPAEGWLQLISGIPTTTPSLLTPPNGRP